MNMSSKMQYTIIFIILLSSIEWSFSAIINLPEDAPTLQEGIEMAADGDIIQINQHDIYFLKEFSLFILRDRYGIRITNKDLTIIGTIQNEKVRVINYNYIDNSHFLMEFGSEIDIPYESDQNSLVIENSIVKIMNLDIESIDLTIVPEIQMIAATQIVNGKLILDNVIFNGLLKVYGDIEIINSTIYGNSYYFLGIGAKSRSGIKAFPALHIRNQESPNIRIINSNFLCDEKMGSRAIIIEKINRGNIQVINSRVTSGSMYNNGMTYDRSETLPLSYFDSPDNKKGLAGIFIVDCTNIMMTMTGSIAKGGERDLSNYQVIPSGPGIEVLNSSNINIYNGETHGGNGSDWHHWLSINDIYEHGSDGGNGLFVTNSTVHLYNHTAIGGKGGEGNPEYNLLPGQDGEPIYQDENSEVIIETNVHDWMLYSN